MEGKIREKKIVRATLVGSVINLILVLLKFTAGILGRSSAMIADAVHSLSDFATDVVVLVFVRISSKPRDANHGYGHGKFETLATVIIGATLFLVGVKLMFNGADKIIGYYFRNEELTSPGMIALIAALASIAAKEFLYQYTLRVGKKEKSMSLIANAWHHRSDALSSIGTALGIGGAIALGSKWNVLDPIAAVIVSLLILKVSIKLTLPALNELLEKSLPVEMREEIREIIVSTPGVLEPHSLYTRRIGNDYAIDVHVLIDENMSVQAAHKLTQIVEKNIREKYGQGTFISIHVEPFEGKGAHNDI